MIALSIQTDMSQSEFKERLKLYCSLASQVGTNTSLCYVYICSCSKFYGDLISLVITTIRAPPPIPKKLHTNPPPTSYNL